MSFSHNLRIATSDDERHGFAAQALEHVGASLFPELDRLRCEQGEGHEGYRRDQEAVVGLLTLVGIPFVRTCSSHRSAIAFLEELAEKTGDPLVRKKLVTYTNQLKQKWNQAEPGGIHHAPRARRRTPASGKPVSNWVSGLAWLSLLCLAIFGLIRLDLTSLVFPGWNRQPPQQNTADTGGAATPVATTPPAVPASEPETPAPMPATTGDFIRYTDDNNVLHLVNDEAKVPARYRRNMKVVASGGVVPGGVVPGGIGRGAVVSDGGTTAGSTQVICRGNQVLVPVSLNYRGHEVQTVLLMDTGASETTINENVAARLGVTRSDLKSATTTVADGRRVPSYILAVDSLSVGGHSLPGAAIPMLPGSGGRGTEGLLGMDFLKEFRYHVDFKRGVIEWGM